MHEFMHDIVKHNFLLVSRILQLKTGGQKLQGKLAVFRIQVCDLLFYRKGTCKQGAKKIRFFFILQSIYVLLHLLLHHMRTHKRYTMQ